jgi:hypothetical protein
MFAMGFIDVTWRFLSSPLLFVTFPLPFGLAFSADSANAAVVAFEDPGVLWRKFVTALAMSSIHLRWSRLDSQVQIKFSRDRFQMFRIATEGVAAVMMNIKTWWNLADQQRVDDAMRRKISLVDPKNSVRALGMAGIRTGPQPASGFIDKDLVSYSFGKIGEVRHA